jgi:phospholipid/cholesterol/gamma-HCH transport system substrate-binding protein
VETEKYDEDSKTSIVTMHVDNGVLKKLGSAPSAHIRPTLVLGGNYYVELIPGGNPGTYNNDRIPLERTSIPIELDQVLSSLNKPAREGAQGTIAKFDDTLRSGTREALRSLLQDSPDSFRPAGDVFEGLEGHEPDKDFTAVVDGFDNAARSFTNTNGKIERIISSLNRTANALAGGGPELAEAARISPEMLRSTRAGLLDLQPTLRKLTDTSPAFDESAKALGPLFDKLDPVLADTRDMVADLRPLAKDLRPSVDDLVPSTKRLTDSFDDLSGPALDRVNGPILATLKSDYHGKPPYPNAGANGNVLYKEIAYLASHLNNTFATFDRDGAFARLTAGIPSSNTLGGSTQLVPGAEQGAEMFGLQQPPGPQGAAPAVVPTPQGPNTLYAPGKNQPSIPKAGSFPSLPQPHNAGAPALPGMFSNSGGK